MTTKPAWAFDELKARSVPTHTRGSIPGNLMNRVDALTARPPEISFHSKQDMASPHFKANPGLDLP